MRPTSTYHTMVLDPAATAAVGHPPTNPPLLFVLACCCCCCWGMHSDANSAGRSGAPTGDARAVRAVRDRAVRGDLFGRARLACSAGTHLTDCCALATRMGFFFRTRLMCACLSRACTSMWWAPFDVFFFSDDSSGNRS